MSSILVTIPESVASQFINHLAKLEPRIANQITIRVLEDSTVPQEDEYLKQQYESMPQYLKDMNK